VFSRAARLDGPMITAGDLKRSIRIELEGDPYVVTDVHFQSPSARGASTLVKAKVRNLRTGQVFEKTFKTADKLQQPDLELRPVQFLYRDDDGWHFMDASSYEQFALGADDLGDVTGFLSDGLTGIRSVVFNGKVISVELPQTVTLKVVDTDPAIKGATAQAQTKPATLETGLVIQVPPYLEAGETVIVDTRDGHFVSRA
jgi:elongation factor P